MNRGAKGVRSQAAKAAAAKMAGETFEYKVRVDLEVRDALMQLKYRWQLRTMSEVVARLIQERYGKGGAS